MLVIVYYDIVVWNFEAFDSIMLLGDLIHTGSDIGIQY